MPLASAVRLQIRQIKPDSTSKGHATSSFAAIVASRRASIRGQILRRRRLPHPVRAPYTTGTPTDGGYSCPTTMRTSCQTHIPRALLWPSFWPLLHPRPLRPIAPYPPARWRQLSAPRPHGQVRAVGAGVGGPGGATRALPAPHGQCFRRVGWLWAQVGRRTAGEMAQLPALRPRPPQIGVVERGAVHTDPIAQAQTTTVVWGGLRVQFSAALGPVGEGRNSALPHGPFEVKNPVVGCLLLFSPAACDTLTIPITPALVWGTDTTTAALSPARVRRSWLCARQ